MRGIDSPTWLNNKIHDKMRSTQPPAIAVRICPRDVSGCFKGPKVCGIEPTINLGILI